MFMSWREILTLWWKLFPLQHTGFDIDEFGVPYKDKIFDLSEI